MWCCLERCTRWFKSVDKTLLCDHSNESFRAVLSCSAVCYIVQVSIFLTVLRMKLWCATIQTKLMRLAFT